VSNTSMRRMIHSFWFVTGAVFLWAQMPPSKKIEQTAIRHAKNVLVSSLDRSLPKVSLEFFLKYEAGGAPIQWDVNDCGEQERNAATDRGLGSPMCVEADFQKDRTGVTVIVSVGTLTQGPSGTPVLYRVTVADQGESRRVRLSDLPMELRRPAPRTPRDLTLPVIASFE
jgi:hypothetical protein